jgi:pSer/pThr/pTyr-binding forkhead associated (FHA) protein
MSSETQIVRIGRGQGCDLVLTHASVSRRHAELTIDADGSISIRDLGSAGGTFVIRGRKEIAVTRAELQRTDRLRLGEYEISVEDLLSLIEGTHPAQGAVATPRTAEPMSDSGERPKTRMVRCACGTIKERGKPCPSCGA